MALGKSAKNQRAQIGFEDTNGVRVPATWKPRSLTLSVSPKAETESITPAGEDFAAVTYQTDEWTEGSGEGVPCYNELMYILYSVFGAPNVVTSGDLVTRVYTFNDERHTMTIETGDSEDAAASLGMYATGLDLEFGKNSKTSKVSLSLSGGLTIDGETLTDPNSLEELPIVPALASHVEVFGSLDPAAMATPTSAQKLTGWMSAKTSIGNTAGRVQYFDRDELVSLLADATFEFKVSLKTSEGRIFADYLREGKIMYILVRQTFGSYLFEQRFAIQVSELGDRGDEGGAYVATYPCVITGSAEYPPSWKLVNKIAAPAPAPEPDPEV